jgi:uncharacterized membrane protein YsdA (DUF1294 family)
LPEDASQAASEQSIYIPDPTVDALIPTRPEVLPPLAEGSQDSQTLPIPGKTINIPVPRIDGSGGMVTVDELIDEARLQPLSEPFASQPAVRPPANEVFKPNPDEQRPDSRLLNMFVTTQRLRELWNQIEALQEEVIQNVRADRSATDAYQQDLLYASSLLMQRPANYDDARQIMYRVRADLKREQRVTEDIRIYRPRLYAYSIVWLIGVLILIGFDRRFRELMPDELPILNLAYMPILFGAFGALCNGVMALHQHTTIKRDFDPVHIGWYIINPLLGGLLGLVVFIFFVVVGSSFTPSLMTDTSFANSQSPAVIWLLAFIVGWQQNILFRLLNRFLSGMFMEREAALVNRPTGTTTPTAVTAPTTDKPEVKG